MENLRMPKGWTLVGTNRLDFGETKTREEKLKKDHKANNILRNTLTCKKLTDIAEDTEKAYKEREENRNNLLKAYNDNKLKSKRLIKEAEAYKKHK
jgi:hypothetical protein